MKDNRGVTVFGTGNGSGEVPVNIVVFNENCKGKGWKQHRCVEQL